MSPHPAFLDAVPRAVEEVPVEGLPALTHPEWRDTFPWLAQGTTCRGDEGSPFDLGLFTDASAPRDVLARWDRLRTSIGLPLVVAAPQIHGAAVRFHGRSEPGLHLAEPCDGHGTRDGGVLLAVTTADCVPVSVVDPQRRSVALLHAGWRGVAAGVLERGVGVLAERMASRPSDLHVHLGPSICGDCYEVGPEVFVALGLPPGQGPALLDLRAELARRAFALGVRPARLSVSAHCTLCGSAGLFSYRRGDRARHAGYLGMRR